MASPNTADPTDGGQFSQGNDGSLYGNPDTPGTASDYSTWTWKQIEAAIDGGSMLLSGDQSQAQGVSNPQTLWQAADIFNNVMILLQNIGQDLQASSQQFAGGDGSPWQGDAANAFATMMTGFSQEVLAAGNVLAGGSSGLDSIPAQLITNGNALSTAQTEIEDLDTYYAEAAVAQGAPIMGNGLVEISAKPVLVNEMTTQMLTVLDQLAHNYQVTVDSIISPNALNNPGDNSNTTDNLNIPNINLNIPNINLGSLNTPNSANLNDGTGGDNLPNLPNTGVGGPADDLATLPNTGTGGLGADAAPPDGLGSLPTTGAGGLGAGAGADGTSPDGLGSLPTTGAGGPGGGALPEDLASLPTTGTEPGGLGTGADATSPDGLGSLPTTGAGGLGAGAGTDGTLPEDLATLPTSSAGPSGLGGASPSGLPGLDTGGISPEGLASLPGTSGGGLTSPDGLPEDLATGASPNLSDDLPDGTSPLSGLPSLTGAGSSSGLGATGGDSLGEPVPALGLTSGSGLPGLTSGGTGTGGLPVDDLSTSGPGGLSATTPPPGEEIPPMMGGGTGAGLGAAGNGTDPSDASGLLSDGTKPWTTSGTGIDTAVAPDELGSPGGTKTGGPGLDGVGGPSAGAPGATELSEPPSQSVPAVAEGDEMPMVPGMGGGATAVAGDGEPSDSSGLLGTESEPWSAEEGPDDEVGSRGGAAAGGPGLDWAAGAGAAVRAGAAAGSGPDADDPSAWETAGAVGEGMLLALGLWSERRRPTRGEEDLMVRTVSSEKEAWTGGAAGAAGPAEPDLVAATWRPDRNATAAPRRRLSLAESSEPAQAEEAEAGEGAVEGEPQQEPDGDPQAGDLLLQEAQMWGTIQADWGEL